MQVTRQRVRPEMHIETVETCPSCLGSGKVESTLLYTDTIKTQLQLILAKYHLKRLTLRTHPFIAAYLNKGFFNSLRKKWGKELGCNISIKPGLSNNLLEYKVFDSNGDEVDFSF
jgi:ribonuclease G